MSRRVYNRRWTDREEELLAALWGTVPDGQAAARLGRSAGACVARAHLRGIARKHQAYTASEIGRLFGVDSKHVAHVWMDRGLLGYQRLPFGAGPHRHWRMSSDAQLRRFVRDRSWAYDPARMAEGEYWTRLARATWRAHDWLGVDTVARSLGVSADRARRLLRSGRIAGVQRRPDSGGPVSGTLLVRRADLEAFVSGWERRGGGRKGVPRSRDARQRTGFYAPLGGMEAAG